MITALALHGGAGEASESLGSATIDLGRAVKALMGKLFWRIFRKFHMVRQKVL